MSGFLVTVLGRNCRLKGTPETHGFHATVPVDASDAQAAEVLAMEQLRDMSELISLDNHPDDPPLLFVQSTSPGTGEARLDFFVEEAPKLDLFGDDDW